MPTKAKLHLAHDQAAATPRRADFRTGLIERVRLARERSGKTPKQMADALGVTVKRYRGWETRSEIRHWFLGPFCDATGVSVRWLLTEHRIDPFR